MCRRPVAVPQIADVAGAVAVAAAVARVPPPSRRMRPLTKFPQLRNQLNPTPRPPRRQTTPNTRNTRLNPPVIFASRIPKCPLILLPMKRNRWQPMMMNRQRKRPLQPNQPTRPRHSAAPQNA